MSNLHTIFFKLLKSYINKITICIIQNCGLGFYVPSNVVTNDDLTKIIDN
jgi:hypothetical protein